MIRKILYSPGYGAGWVSWNSSPKELAEYLLTYQPIIDFLEAGGEFEDRKDEDYHPILQQLKKECREKFNEDVYLGGCDQLEVATVSGRVRIEEYDGNEWIVEEGTDEWM